MKNYMLVFSVIIILSCLTNIFSQSREINFLTADSSQYNFQGTWTTSNYIEFYDSEDSATPIAIYQFNSETSYYLLNTLSLAGNLYAMYPHGFRFEGFDEHEVRNTFGLGASLMLRCEFVQLFGQNLFAEAGIGFVTTSKDFPPLGTRWNFTQRYGFGMNIPINESLILIFGVRHMHISNGKGFVRENPQYNGNGVYFGTKFEI